MPEPQPQRQGQQPQVSQVVSAHILDTWYIDSPLAPVMEAKYGGKSTHLVYGIGASPIRCNIEPTTGGIYLKNAIMEVEPKRFAVYDQILVSNGLVIYQIDKQGAK